MRFVEMGQDSNPCAARVEQREATDTHCLIFQGFDDRAAQFCCSIMEIANRFRIADINCET